MRFLRYLLRELHIIRAEEGVYRKQLAALEAECADLPKPRVIYPTPDRDKTHKWDDDNDVLALALKRERDGLRDRKVVSINAKPVNPWLADGEWSQR